MDDLVAMIRRFKSVTRGEACQFLNVGPWQVDRYRTAIVQIHEDIRWNSDQETFEIIIGTPPKSENDARQRSVEEHVRRLQGPEEA
jgi:hypothetical protein